MWVADHGVIWAYGVDFVRLLDPHGIAQIDRFHRSVAELHCPENEGSLGLKTIDSTNSYMGHTDTIYRQSQVG